MEPRRRAAHRDIRRATLALLAGLLAGCGGTSAAGGTGASGGATGDVGGTAATPVASACAAVSAAQVSADLGYDVGAPTSAVSGAETLCLYPAGPRNVEVRVTAGADASTIAAAKAGLGAQGQPVVALSGLGDEAYAATLDAGGFSKTVILVRRGTLEIYVSAPAPAARVQALAAAVLPRVAGG